MLKFQSFKSSNNKLVSRAYANNFYYQVVKETMCSQNSCDTVYVSKIQNKNHRTVSEVYYRSYELAIEDANIHATYAMF